MEVKLLFIALIVHFAFVLSKSVIDAKDSSVFYLLTYF